MPPRKKGDIEKKIGTELVRYQMNVAYMCLRSEEKSVVEVGKGKFGEIVKPKLELDGMNAGNGVFTTRYYDPKVKADLEFIKEVDAFIEENPHWSTHVDAGLKRLEEHEAIKPFDKFDSITDMQALRQMLVYGDYDIPSAVKYELQKPEDEQRKEVLEVLESIPELREVNSLETSEEVMSL